MTVENCGQQVTIPRPPERIMTVGHEAVELIYAAGGADRVVVRAGGVDAPDPAGDAIAGARRLEVDPTAEVILGSEVDLVVSYGLFDVSIEQLNDAGVTSLIVSGLCGQHGGGTGDGADFEDVYADIELYGHLLGTEAQAAAAVAQLRERVAAVEGRVQGEEPMAAAHVYIFGDGFLATSGNQSMPQSQMEVLGLDNLFGDVPADYTEGNLEELIARDPEVIILTYGHTDGETFEQARDKLLALPGAEDMRAVRHDRIIPLPFVQSQASTSAVTGIEAIAEGLPAV